MTTLKELGNLLVYILAFLISSCSATVKANVEPMDFQNKSTTGMAASETPAALNTWEYTPTINVTTRQYLTSYTPQVTNTPVQQLIPSRTNSPEPSDTPEPPYTSFPIYISAGSAVTPILLYHIVSDQGNGNRYSVSVDAFRQQMQSLLDLGYTAITPSQLANVLINGGELPARPVVITFDDGNQTVYTKAYPIMREMGYIGAVYIYVDRLNYPLYVNVEQLQEMVDQGWEIGSHSLSHSDLTQYHASVPYELLQSRLVLEEALGLPVRTFAYPYGKADDYIRGLIDDYGYIAGMGVGSGWEHTIETLTFLNRIEVQSDFDLSRLLSLLPWGEN